MQVHVEGRLVRGFRALARPLLTILIAAALLTNVSVSPAAAVEPFDLPVVSVNQTGDIIYAANTLMTCPASTACTDAQSNAGGTARANNNFTMIDVDVDGNTGIGASTFNSSSAMLNLPAGASVTWAGLFWGASSGSASRDEVQFQVPGSASYQTVTSPAANVYNNGNAYQAFADVTSIVQGAGAGAYTTANVQRTTGSGRYAGWTLVVVTSDPSQPFRNLAVFDGFQLVNQNNPVDVTVSGFLSPPVGPVNAEIGIIAYEGDDRFTGDFAQLNGSRLGDALSPTTNFFNSRITDGGVYATGGNPNYFDQLGYDAKIIETVGIVPPGATSATVQLRSAGDWYYPGVVTTAIDIFVPNLVIDLEKTVTDVNGGDVNVGDTLTYSISFTNQGEDAALDTVVRDAIPAGSTYVPGSATVISGDNPGSANASFNAGTGEVEVNIGIGATPTDGGRVAPFSTTGTFYDIQFQVTVDAGTENTNIDNVGELDYVAETLGDAFTAETPLRRVTVEPVAELSLVSKTDTLDPVMAGETTSYSIEVANAGPSPAENTDVVDTLPAGFTFVSGTGCSTVGQVVTCALGTVAAGASATATFTVAVDGDAPARIETNNARVESTTPDIDPTNNFGTETTEVTRLVDLETVKTFVPNPAQSGGQVTYTVTVSNNGPSDAQNVDLTDGLPGGVGFISAVLDAPTAGSCAEINSVVTCSFAELAAGDSETVTIVVDVPSSVADGTVLVNKAGAQSDDPEDPSGAPETDVTSTPVGRSADLSIDKTATGPFVAGGIVSFELAVTNDGPSDATDVVVTDTLPPGMTFVPASSSATCALVSGQVQCDLAQLDGGGSATFTIGVELASSLADGAVLTNEASVEANEADPVSANDSDTLDITIERSTDLAIVKQATPDVVAAGSQVTYTLDVENIGPSDATAVAVTDVLPAGVTLVSAPGCTGTTTLTCSIGNLAAGASASFTVTVAVPSGTTDGTALVNTATVAAAEDDPNATNDTSGTSTNVVRTTSLELTKVESSGFADPAQAGTPISWDIVVTNTGPSDDADITVTDDLSALPITGATATITNSPTNSCTITPGAGDPGSLDCDIPILTNGQSVTIVVSGILDSGIIDGTAITNEATASSPTSPAVSGTEETTINRTADLDLTKTGPATIVAGTTATWVVTVTNDGPGAADDIVLTDILPPNATYVTHRVITGTTTCSTATGPLVCDTPQLDVAPNNVITIEIDATVADTAVDGTTVANNATVTSTTTDPDPDNNEASATSNIEREADLSLQKTALDDPIAAGEDVRFVLTAANGGPSIATDVVVGDILPAGFTFVPAASDANCVAVGGGAVVECSTPILDPDDPAVSFVITLTADAAIAAGTFTNAATIDAAETDPNSTNDDAVADVEVERRADINISKTAQAGPAIPGESFEWTIDVVNAGPSSSTATEVTDILPAGVTFDAASSDSRCAVTAGTPATGQTVTCTLGDLAPTASETLVISVDVDPTTGAGATGATLDNVANVDTTTPDPNPDNDQSTTTTPIVAQADLSTTKVGPATVVAGEAIAWTVTVSNAGPSQATSVVMTDTLPAGVTFDPISSDPNCSVTAGLPATGETVTCAIATVDPGTPIDLVIGGSVDPSAIDGSILTNQATVDSATDDPDGSNDASTSDTSVTRTVSLSVSKSVTPTTVAAGETVTYTISLTNDGPSSASLATLTDTLDAALNLDAVNVTTAGSCTSAIVCTVTDLQPGDSLVATIEATVQSSTADGVTIGNTVTAAAPEDPTPQSASAPITVTRSADLAVTKTAAVATADAGESVTYTVELDNLGPSDATSVTITDPVPAGLTYLDAASDSRCDLVGSNVVCTIGTVPFGAPTTSLDLVFDIDPAAPAGSIANTATGDAAEDDPDTTNDAGTDTITITTEADLSVAKTSTTDPIVPGQPYEWTITAANAGPSTAVGAVVTDTLPAGVTHDATNSDPRCSVTAGTPATGQTITCTLGDIAPTGATATTTIIIITGDVDPTVTDTTLTNSASVESSTPDSTPGNDDATDESPVAPSADLSVVKVGPASVIAGNNLAWTITAANAGPSTAVGAVVTDPLPAGVTYDPTNSDPRCSVTSGTPTTGQTITCTLGDMAPTGATATTSIIITGELDDESADGGELVNTASIDSSTDDPDPDNDDGDSRTDVDRVADLQITKVADAGVVIAGENVTYTIVVTNVGPSVATDVNILDTLAAGLTVVSATPIGVAPTGTCDITGNAVDCTQAQLDPGSTFEVEVVATVDADVVDGSGIENTASATATEDDPDGAEATETITADTSADLGITKTLLTTAPVAGEPVTFELVVSNDGPSDATNVIVTDTLPVGATFQATGSTASCVSSATGATCSLGVVAAGTSQTLTIVADLDPSVAAATLVNSAGVTGTEDDPNSTNDSDSADIPIVRSADLAIDKVAPTTPPTPGLPTSWTLDVSNLGPSTATNVVITDTLPAGTTFDPAASDARCVVTAGTPATGETITCTLPSLADSANDSFIIGVDVDPTLTGDIANTASVSADEDDPDTTNDTETVTSTVTPSADLSIDKVRLTDPLVAGENVTYELTVTNDGPSTAVGVIVDDVFPGVLAYDDPASDVRCDLVGTSVTCALGDLIPGAVETISLTFMLDEDATSLSLVTNTASVTSSTPDPDEGLPGSDNTSTNDGAITRSADLSIVKTGAAELTAGGTGSYTITVANAGPSIATNVSISDAVPAGLTITGFTGPAGCSTTTSALACSISSMPPGDTIDITVDVDVASSVADGATLTNSAAVSGSEPDPDPSNDGSSVTADVVRSADLSLTKSILTSPVVAGEPVLFELTVDNAGVSDATGITVTDLLPAGLTYRPDLSSTACSPAGATITCSNSTLPAGSSITFLIGADTDQDLATGSTLTNDASVTGTESDPDTSNDDASTSAPITREADLSIIKRGPGGPSTAGTSLTWTLDIANDGASQATNIVVTDTLPPGATFQPLGSDSRCAAAGSIVTCTIASLDAGAADELIIEVDLAAGLADGFVLTNDVNVTADEPDPNTTNNESSHTADIARSSGLAITKVDVLDPVVAGESIAWDIQVTNIGPSDTDNVEVVDTLPIGITFDPTTSDPSCSLTSGTPATGQIITCLLGTLNVGDAPTVRIAGAVDQGFADGTLLVNEATASGDLAPAVSITEETTVNRSAEVTVTKVAGTSPITPGVVVTYTLTVENVGPSQATNIELTDLIPPGGTVTDVRVVSSPSTFTCTTGTATVVCPVGTLDAGATATIEIDVLPAAFLATGDTFENKAVVTGDEDPTPGEGSTVDPIERSVDLSIDKTAASTTVAAGAGVTYDLTVTNAGPSNAANIVVTDTLPSGMTFDASTTSPSCVASTVSTVTCIAPLLAAGDSLTFTVGVLTDATATGELTNTVTVASDEANSNPDPTDAETITLAEVADLEVIKTGPETVVAGEEISYEIEIGNFGPSIARNVVIVDEIPAGLAISIPTDCSLTGSVLTCNAGDIAVGDTEAITLTGTVDADYEGVIRNVAAVSSDGSDPNPDNDVATTQATVERVADLSITKELVTSDLRSGGEATWSIVVTNDGPSTATDVVVTDDLPAGLSVLSTATSTATSTGLDTCDDTIRCELGDLEVDGSITIIIDTAIATSVVGSIENSASVEAAESDPTAAEASASGQVSRSTSDLSITKTATSGTLTQGSTVVWAIQVTNDGPDDIITPITVTDDLPTTLSYVSHSAPVGTTCTVGGQSVDCTTDELASGESVVIQIVTSTRTSVTNVTNTASAAASGLADGEGPDGTVRVAASAVARAPQGSIAFTGSSTGTILLVAAALLIIGVVAVRISRREDEAIA